jgi:hypothetical protein
MIDEPQVVVGADHDAPSAVDENFISGSRLDRMEIGVDPHFLDHVCVVEIESFLKDVIIGDCCLVLSLQIGSLGA